MARQARINLPHSIYHILNRGLDRRPIFHDDSDRHRFLEIQPELFETYGISTLSYCLMSNHFHLVIRTGERANLSEAFRNLLGGYVQSYHFRHKTDGPLFRGRYSSCLVTDEAYLRALIPYVHNNPVKAGIVSDPTKYAWSSFRHYLTFLANPESSQKAMPWLSPELFDIQSTKSFRAFHEAALSADHRFEERIPTAQLNVADQGLRVQLKLNRNITYRESDADLNFKQQQIESYCKAHVPVEFQTSLMAWALRKYLGRSYEELKSSLKHESIESTYRLVRKVQTRESFKNLRLGVIRHMKSQNWGQTA